MITSDGFHTQIRVILKVNVLIQCIILYKINENEFYLKKQSFLFISYKMIHRINRCSLGLPLH